MNQAIELPAPAGLIGILSAHAGASLMLQIAARLSLQTPLRILDCGNRCNAYAIAKSLRGQTRDPAQAMNNILISRAFTCYQVETLAARTAERQGMPVLVLDLLNTFLDESVSRPEGERLLVRTLESLRKIGQASPTIVSIKPLPTVSADRRVYLEMAREKIGTIYRIENPTETQKIIEDKSQPQLF